MSPNGFVKWILAFYIAGGLISVDSIGIGGDVASPSFVVENIRFQRGLGFTEISQVDNDLLLKTNTVQLRINPEIFECMSKLQFNGTLKTTSLAKSGVKQWSMWSVDRFDKGEEMRWMPTNTSTCGKSQDSFLGGHCKLGFGRVKRIYNDIPSHTEIKVTGRVHFFDMWNGEYIILKADDTVLWTESHNWCPSVTDTACKKYGIDVCGQEYPDRLSVYFNVSMKHENSVLSLEFKSTLDKNTNPCDVSWGIDDIALYIR
ncbi:conserved hypothetical protein [Theileria equi strain WA]|uniref:Uncharacterized protein n=1 Tax=Theileria equi strain WA TaxID=1537102 RepID=L1LEN1_THEEQ|nr:conserved hypothetical protein [Theileria equi strain WA]EKX73781.1 conserved hypothetical protein [Theileria equi strain WA]|eukprot:XP_004833233.1 conserved hypothetical protein [Theileria equi strain WA]